MQLTGSPYKLYIPCQFMEAVRLRLRKVGKYFTTDPDTLERLHGKYGEDFQGVEEGVDHKAWGGAFVPKMAMLNRGTLFEVLEEVMGLDAKVRIDAYGGKRTLGKGGLSLVTAAHTEGGMVMDVGFTFSYATALREAGKHGWEDGGPLVGGDRTPLRPLIGKIRGSGGIRKAVKERTVFLSGGSFTGGNVVVKFENNIEGKAWGDKALTVLGFNMVGRGDLRLKEVKLYDAVIGHMGRTDEGPLRKLLRGKVRGAVGSGREG